MKPDVPAQAVPFVTVSVNVRVAIPPGPKALTVTVYAPGGILAGCAFVTRTTPVAVFASNLPLKPAVVETFMLVAPVGAASGVITALLLNPIVVAGYIPSVGVDPGVGVGVGVGAVAVTTTQAENSEVLPLGSVAVDVTNWPSVTATGNTALTAALLPMVVTDVNPRKF